MINSHPSLLRTAACGISGLRAQSLPLFIAGWTVLLWARPGLAQMAPGWTHTDIGNPGVAGDASFSGGIWTVSGGGADIWNRSDAFHFAYQTAVTNYSVLSSRVTSQEATDAWAKAGVMFRDSTAANSTFAMVVATPGNGVSFQWRSATGSECSHSQAAGINIPVWVRLAREGTSFRGFYSADGATWIPIGPSQTVPMRDLAPGGLAVTAHDNAKRSTATFSNTSAVNTPGPPPPPPLAFGVYRELWTDLNGGGIGSLTNTSNNPDWPDRPNPVYTKVFTNFEAEIDFLDAYGQRARTFVVPPVDGDYRFWIASDDNSTLFLSTDEDPANKMPIAGVPGWTNPREWSIYPEQMSGPVRLEGRRRYYLEALMVEGGGGDNLAVRWQLPNGTFEEPLTASSPAGTRLIPFDGLPLAAGIHSDSGNLTVNEGAEARFYVLVTNRSPVSYQWKLNGGDIPGAIKAGYTIPSTAVSPHNGQTYRCVVSTSAGSATSSIMTLSVVADTTRPAVVRVLNIGATNVLVVFSEPVELASATSAGNYTFSGGPAVSKASAGPDAASVLLTTAPMTYGTAYTLAIRNVRDRASSPNVIAANTEVRFTALAYASQDIGNPPRPTAVATVENGVDITASGSGTADYADQLGFAYSIRAGDFDVAARLEQLSLTDVWAQAGLMARETLEPGSRFAAAFATPAMNGSLFEFRELASGKKTASGAFPVNYPYTWLRLKRLDNQFTGYASYDGLSWTALGSKQIAMPAQIFLGLGVGSHDAAQSTSARFRDMADVTSGVIASQPNPREAPGPSSRKSPIAITEIMYKPVSQADGANLEFIELYNSNPWFQDISGYRLKASNLAYAFPAGTVMAGGAYLVIAASPGDMRTAYGRENVLGPYTGSLKNPDELLLLDEHGSVLLAIPYSGEPPWPVAPDGTGHSLVLARPSYGEADPKAWEASDAIGGSPGQRDPYRPSPLRAVVINEFLAHTDLPDLDYIELHNHANQAVDISGCILTDDPRTNRFVIPDGTMLPARGFAHYTETTLGFALKAAGETVYLKSADETRVLDAVRFGGQENGISTGRWPDGADDWYRLAAKTPEAANAAIRPCEVVINEIMYDPISQNDDDQYVELYNRGGKPVDLDGWRLAGGISYAFPATTLPPGGYIVIARDATRLRAAHAHLNLNNCLGNFGGRLKHGGERIALEKTDTVARTNSAGIVETDLIHIVVNEVTYGSGGRWGRWSHGGGSSLELVDASSNNRLAANWDDSDETRKSAWTNIETTAVLDNGANYDSSISFAQIGLMDVGECLVDNVQVSAGTGGPNLVKNPDFDAGSLANWSLQGCMSRSSLEAGGYGGSARSLHIRASSRLFTGVNSCQMALDANNLAAGQTATLRFKARWLRGWPEVLLRLNGNWLDVVGALPIPPDLGSPGAPNSRAVANAGPAIYSVRHAPALPGANENCVVTARAHDPQGLSTLKLFYRLDPSTSYASAIMKDDGAGGDAISGDGIFSAVIPGQALGVIAAFYISANDVNGAASRFPAPSDDRAPARECVVRFGDTDPGGSFGSYHLWITQTNVQRWIDLSNLSNESHDCTMVSGDRIIYNTQARWAGSPYHQGFNTPYGNLCHYKWVFPDDDKLLGATSFNKIHQPGNGAGDDASIQREQLAQSLLRKLGVPSLNRRYVAVFVNGNRRGTLMEDTQTPDGDVVEQYFPDDSDGWLYKMQPWFEFGPYPQGNSIPFANMAWCSIMPYTTTGGVKKAARYRYNFLVRRTPVSANDFSNVFALVDAAGSYNSPNYAANMENIADMENWMRVFAANHAAGNWDAFGCANAQNLYGYIGTKDTRYSLLMFDFNIVFGNSGSWGPGQNLFEVNGGDPNLQRVFQTPVFRRMYWRALGELVDGPLNPAVSGPLLDAKYEAFTANRLKVENPNFSLKAWISSARNSIAAQMAAENPAAFTVDGKVNISGGVGYLTGKAPVNVKTVRVNGADYPLEWTSVGAFRVAIPLKQGANAFSVNGIDMRGNNVPGASGSASVNYNGPTPIPTGSVVINEIMFAPLLAGGEYVELFNNSTTATYDLSGCVLSGLSYTFPEGATIGPRACLILAAQRPAFARAYGATVPVFDTFGGKLQTDGETLKLLKPGYGGAPDTLIAGVKYENRAPWPGSPITPGTSLQLVDASQTSSRVANWGVGASGSVQPKWVYFATNGVATASTLYLYLQSAGEIYLDDIRFVAGETPGAGPNLIGNGDFEGAFPGPWSVSANFAQSAASTTVKHSGSASLRLVAGAGGSGSGNSIYQNLGGITNGQPYALSFWYLQSSQGGPLTVRLSRFGVTSGDIDPAPRGAGATLTATPGALNSTRASLATFPNIWINEVQPENLAGLKNSAGQPAPWIELFNAGTTPVALSDLYLTDDFENLAQWSFPAGALINPGEFKVVFADGQTALSTPAEPHASFVLAPGTGSVALSRNDGGDLQVLDYLNYAMLSANRSFGSYPDGQNLSRQTFFVTTPKAANSAASPALTVAVNEWMAANTSTLVNPVTGKYGDWFELYNYGSSPADISGYYLTDTPTNTTKFRIPAGYVIPPGAWLLVWADGKSTNGTPDLHVSFKLSKAGSSIGLYGADGTPVDLVTFGTQMEDVSSGRYPDGQSQIFIFSQATPGTANAGPNAAPVIAPLSDQYVKAGRELRFEAVASDLETPAELLIFSLGASAPPGATLSPRGQFSWTPGAAQAPGTYSITLVATDNGSPAMSASQSFTVFVTQPNTPPVLAGIPDFSIEPNHPLSFTAQATDSDIPPQTIIYSLGSGAPPGAVISPEGAFSWTPTIAQAPSTNMITVEATDSGDPPLTARKSFTVVVASPMTEPAVVLEFAGQAYGPYTRDPDAEVDTDNKLITTTASTAMRFYRIRSNSPVSIKLLKLKFNQVFITYE